MSHGKIEKFARMANQIGDAFSSMPAEEAARATATHILKFWTPKMIGETLAALETGTVQLGETARNGFAILKREHAPAG